MKMYYGNVPVNSMKVKHYDVSTNDATMIASDLQAGITAYARGQKIMGTGKCFEFAVYGKIKSNFPTPIPLSINVIEIASMDYPVQLSIALSDMKSTDFTTEQTIGNVIVGGTVYPVTVKAESNILTINCTETIWFQIFYGKDNYI